MEPKFFFNSSYYFSETIVCYITLDVPLTKAATISMYLLYIFVSSLSFLTIWGNLLVITSIIYFKQLHTPTNYLMLSLAVSDLLVGVLLVLYEVLPYNFINCIILNAFDDYLRSCSVWNLCFISVERYYVVCQPLKYRRKMTVRVIVIMILMSWFIPALVSVIVVLQDAVAVYLPTFTMCVLYLKILMVAQRQARSIQNTTCQSTNSESKMERKATKTMGIVMGVFLICWTPFFFRWAILLNNQLPMAMMYTVMFLGWLNSMLNPFIYGLFYSWFRSAFRMIITGKIFQGDFTHSKLS